MIDQRHAETVLHAYFRAETAHDKPAWMALFAPEIVFEDPVGARAFNGLEGLERFWAGIADKQIRASTTAPVNSVKTAMQHAARSVRLPDPTDVANCGPALR